MWPWNADWRPDMPVAGGRRVDCQQVGHRRESCPCLS